MKHEQYVERVAEHVIATAPAADRERISKARIGYGIGHQRGLRGVTYFDRWTTCDGEHIDMIEICAFGEESPTQLAATTVHELAHVLAGHGAGHGPEWKAACARLGLRKARVGMTYNRMHLRADIRALVDSIAPTDGVPHGIDPITGMRLTGAEKPRPCPMGIGTRGGKSRGTGSGSRMRKYVCQCSKPVIIRHAGDALNATCGHCAQQFTLA